MDELTGVPWPPAPLKTERLLLRRTGAEDRDGFIALRCSQDVYQYLGGALPRDRAELEAPEVPGDRAGVFAVERNGTFIGMVSVERRDPMRPGALNAEGAVAELSYLFLPEYWGRGYATEAAAAVLSWVDRVLPREPIVLCTQTANTASVQLAGRLGFQEIERFVEFDAEQWFGVRPPRHQSAG